VRCNHQFGFSDFTSSPWFDATRLAARSGIARRASTDAAGSQAPGRPSWSPNPDDVPCAPAPGTCGSSSQPELGRAGIDEAPPSFSDVTLILDGTLRFRSLDQFDSVPQEVRAQIDGSLAEVQ
jgi:hypothetical protein